MQRIAKRIGWIGVVGIACALLVGTFGCSEMGKRYITVYVESDQPRASVEVLFSGGLSGSTFSLGPL